MTLENLIYLFEQPFYLGTITLVCILLFLVKFGERIYTWYQFKYHDFGTCKKCGNKQDNMWYLTCMKCYNKQQKEMQK